MTGADELVACRCYTAARRYPWVIGRIAGWRLPTQLTLTQVAAIGASFGMLAVTRGLWAHLPRLGNLGVEVLLPGGAAWGARRVRVEGRSPVRALAGLVTYLATPRLGRVGGRAVRDPLPRRLTGTVFAVPARAKR